MKKVINKNLNKIGLTFILVMALIMLCPALTKAEKKFP